MAQTLLEKSVLFYGLWRARHSVDDQFFRMVSQQLEDKPGARATWQLTTEGLTILVTQSESGRQGKTDQIPVQAIKEVSVNHYNQLCLMTLYFDATHHCNALVCRCQSEQDAQEAAQEFRQLQKSFISSRGMNWSLKPKQNGDGGRRSLNGYPDRFSNNGSVRSHDAERGFDYNHFGEVVVITEEETLSRESTEIDGRPCFNVGVQAELDGAEDFEGESTVSDVSYQVLKEELLNLSTEVRDIKLLLEQSTGISSEEFFCRQRENDTLRLVPVKRVPPQEVDGNDEKRVNFADVPEDQDIEFDIRSVGMQTMYISSKRVKYHKRVRHALVPTRYQHSSVRSRSGSSNSPSPVSPISPYGTQPHSYFNFIPPGHRFQDFRQGSKRGKSSISKGGTVVRPIESVYQVHTPGFRQKRQQVIVLPTRSYNMPRQVMRTFSEPPARQDQVPEISRRRPVTDPLPEES